MRNLLHHFDNFSSMETLFNRMKTFFARLRASRIVYLPRNLIVSFITIYQHTLSPDHGPLRHLYTYGYCRHSPTCSEYAKEIVRKRGIIRGIPMSMWRLLHCNPFAKPSEKRVMEIIHH